MYFCSRSSIILPLTHFFFLLLPRALLDGVVGQLAQSIAFSPRTWCQDNSSSSNKKEKQGGPIGTQTTARTPLSAASSLLCF